MGSPMVLPQISLRLLIYNVPEKLIFSVEVKHECDALHVIVFALFHSSVLIVRLLIVLSCCLSVLIVSVISVSFTNHNTSGINSVSTKQEAVTGCPVNIDTRRGFSRRICGVDVGLAAINKSLFTYSYMSWIIFYFPLFF